MKIYLEIKHIPTATEFLTDSREATEEEYNKAIEYVKENVSKLTFLEIRIDGEDVVIPASILKDCVFTFGKEK